MVPRLRVDRSQSIRSEKHPVWEKKKPVRTVQCWSCGLWFAEHADWPIILWPVPTVLMTIGSMGKV